MRLFSSAVSPSTSAGPLSAAEAAPLQHAYAVGVAKTRRNIARLAAAPKSAAWAVDGDYFAFKEGFFEIGNWTSSFFTGMALLAYESTKDEFFLRQTERLAGVYRDKVFVHGMDTMHDLGFLYSLYSVALHRLTGKVEHREVGLKAAEELAKRFHPAGGFIQAWGCMDERKTDYAGLAIIDCMMNLPLLFWAADQSGARRFRDIAVCHADTTLACFICPDDSVFHAYRFDPATGARIGGDNYCGYNVGSHWARGTTWAIYGFALAYRHTGDQRYLDLSRQLAAKFIGLLDTERVPVWDFRLPPGAPPLRDASAAAVAVCGFDELTRHLPGEMIFAQTAELLLARLCTADYLDADSDCPGVLRNAQVGDGIGKAKNAYASWGDYFFMEALARRLHAPAGYW